MKNKNIAIIPARIGSKRLKYKNIRIFKKKPLIFWTVKAAIESKIFNKIYISTDSKLIKEKLFNFKKKIEFLDRPKKFSGPKTKTSTLIKYLIKRNYLNKKYTNFFLLQPTSPLRSKQHILSMWKIFKKNDLLDLISVSEKINKTKINLNRKLLYKKNGITNKKIKKKIYQNGAVYIKNINYFLKYPKFLCRRSSLYLMNKIDSLDVDYEKDLKH